MNYQEAAKIRKKGFLSSITDKLVEGQGIGSSIKSTISEKSAARVKGFKEKIDPMNIIKFMTGGSKLAAAMYGSMRGRSQEDMKYFAGSKAKEVGGSATKIGQLESDNEAAQLLLKIYEFMRNTAEEDKLRKQKETNRKEELEYERSLRHKALIEALTGLAKPGTTVTATKEPSESGFGGLFAGLIGFIKGLIDDAIKGVMAVVKGIMDVIENLEDKLFKILANKVLWSSIIRNVPQLLWLWGIYESKQYLDNILYAERMKQGEGKAAQKAFRQKQTDFSLLPLTQDQAKAILEQDPSPGKDRDIAAFGGIERVQAIADGKPDPGGVAPQSNQDIKNKLKENEEIRRIKKEGFTPTSQAEAQDLENGASQQAVPVPVTPASNKLNEKTKEMNDANLPAPALAPKSEVVNTTNIMADKKMMPIGPLPAVRNTEPTFANMILYSTRVV